MQVFQEAGPRTQTTSLEGLCGSEFNGESPIKFESRTHLSKPFKWITSHLSGDSYPRSYDFNNNASKIYI